LETLGKDYGFPAFLKSCYTGIRTFSGSLEMSPAWRHLKDYRLLVKKTPARADIGSGGRKDLGILWLYLPKEPAGCAKTKNGCASAVRII